MADGGKYNFERRSAASGERSSNRMRALVVSDSRGAGISRQVNRNQKLATLKKVRVDIRILPGATLRELRNAIANANAFHSYQLIIVVGGICDLTVKSQYDKLNILEYPAHDPDKVVGEFILLRDEFGDKIIFSTISPASLVKYAKVKNNIECLPRELENRLTTSQVKLVQDLEYINSWIKEDNKQSHCTNLDHSKFTTSCSIKKPLQGQKYRKEKFSDKNLYDGLHANSELKTKWHQRTTDVIFQEMNKRFFLGRAD